MGHAPFCALRAEKRQKGLRISLKLGVRPTIIKIRVGGGSTFLHDLGEYTRNDTVFKVIELSENGFQK